MPQDVSLTQPGRFVVGCNYWASHAGTATWSDWRADVVARDFKQLSAAGLQVLRVFPLWPDFQPLTQLYTYAGQPVEMRHGEQPLGDDDAGRSGVSSEAMAKFAALADLADKHGLRLIVGLVTGWMSGRLFVPSGLQGRNVITDPVAIMWQVRFVRHFVETFRDHPAVAAWDLGNECNCMGEAGSREAAWVWTASIVNAVRAVDATRPIVSGMHSLSADAAACWTIADQAELTDLLTTHPYTIFTPHCDHDPIHTIRTVLHSTAESRFYADLGRRPCLAEEIGTLGPMVAGPAAGAAFVRTALFSLWAHDCHGLLWWCAYDQAHLAHAPYDWGAVERELGLFRQGRGAKPVLKEISAFARFLRELPVPALPPRLVQGVCILSRDQDQWASAFSSFILAKQAGFDIEFQHADQPLKDAPLYFLPSLKGSQSLSRRTWLALHERVKLGATLYVSHDDCLLSPMNELFGLEVRTRRRAAGPVRITMDSPGGAWTLTAKSDFTLDIAPTTAEVLAREGDGNPAFTCNAFGRGRAYFLTVPIERALAETSGAFHEEGAQPFWMIYRRVAEAHLAQRAVSRDDPMVGVTEHPLTDRRRVVVLINYGTGPAETNLSLAKGWRVTRAWYGQAPAGNACRIPANDAAVFTISCS